MIHVERTRRVDHDNIYARLDIAVLETVVHDYEFRLGMLGLDAADGIRTFFAHHHQSVGELQLHLQRLIPHVAIRRLGRNLDIPLRTASVSAREERHATILHHVGHDHLGRRGLARTADGDVSHADDRRRKLFALEQPAIEHPMADIDHHAIGIGQEFEQKSHIVRLFFVRFIRGIEGAPCRNVQPHTAACPQAIASGVCMARFRLRR